MITDAILYQGQHYIIGNSICKFLGRDHYNVYRSLGGRGIDTVKCSSEQVQVLIDAGSRERYTQRDIGTVYRRAKVCTRRGTKDTQTTSR